LKKSLYLCPVFNHKKEKEK
jgi:hypothetical protein